MPIIEEPIRLPRPVFLAAWNHEQLGDAPAVVEQTAMYTTEEFRSELRRRAVEQLARLGLVAGDALAPRLRHTLKLLAGARREVYSWSDFGRHRDDNGAILVAAAGRESIRLITDGRTVQLEPVSSRNPAAGLMKALPGYAPARIRPLRVPKTYYDADGCSDDPLTEAATPAVELRHLMHAERSALHQLHAARRDGDGNRVHSTPLSAIDLVGRGRILSFVNHDRDGEPQINLYSGTRAHLVDALNLTLDELG